MIESFRGQDTEELFYRRRATGLPSTIWRVAHRKRRQLHVASTLQDMRVPPGNHLEALEGDRKGQHSIRINVQWRICFHWRDGNAYDVEIVDYH